MIDLHIHTKYSDGTDDLKTLFQKIKKTNLTTISITDHDTIDAYLDIEKNNYQLPCKLINGIEIKTTYQEIPIEILGYNIDIEKFKQSPIINKENKLNNQKKYLENYKKCAHKLNLTFNPDLKLDQNRPFAGITFYLELIKYPENFDKFPLLKTINAESFYRETSANKKSIFYIDESNDYPSIDFVIDEIHRCNGYAFLAHLYEYRCHNHQKLLKDIFTNTKIDGCECYHSLFTEENIHEIKSIAQKYHKLTSGGSDYHGTNKQNYYLGIVNQKPIPDDIINW